MNKATRITFNTYPGDWTALPWIRSLDPTEVGKGLYQKGWQFSWLFIQIQRYTMNDDFDIEDFF